MTPYDESLVIPTKAEHVRANIFLLQLLNCGTRYIACFSDCVDQDKLLDWISNGYVLLTWYEGDDYYVIPFDEFRHDKIEASGTDPIWWFMCPYCLNWMALGELFCLYCERDIFDDQMAMDIRGIPAPSLSPRPDPPVQL